MLLLKNRNLFSTSKDIARNNQISSHKNYSIIGMRLGLIFNHELQSEKVSFDMAK